MNRRFLRSNRRLLWGLTGALALVVAGTGAVIAGVGGGTSPAPTVPFVAPKTNQPAPPPPTPGKSYRSAGIFDVKDSPLPNFKFVTRNSWQGPVNGSGDVWYVIWAGALRHPESVGPDGKETVPLTPAIQEYTSTPTPDGNNFTQQEVGVFSDASVQGALTIAAVNGSVVSLRSDSGSLVIFDLLTHLFQ